MVMEVVRKMLVYPNELIIPPSVSDLWFLFHIFNNFNISKSWLNKYCVFKFKFRCVSNLDSLVVRVGKGKILAHGCRKTHLRTLVSVDLTFQSRCGDKCIRVEELCNGVCEEKSKSSDADKFCWDSRMNVCKSTEERNKVAIMFSLQHSKTKGVFWGWLPVIFSTGWVPGEKKLPLHLSPIRTTMWRKVRFCKY